MLELRVTATTDQQGRPTWRPPHRLTFVEALVYDLVDRCFHEAGGNALARAKAFTVVHELTGVVCGDRLNPGGDIIGRVTAERGNGVKWRVMVELTGSNGAVGTYEIS